MTANGTPKGQGHGTGSGDPPVYRFIVLEISEIQVGERFRKNPTEGLESLMASIKRVGLLHPPVVTEKRLLVVGQRRLEAFKALGRTKIPVRMVKNLEDGLLVAEQDENTERLDYAPSEARALAKAIEPRLRAEAKERQREGGRRKGKLRGSSRKQGAKGKAKDLAAKAAGMSRRTLKKIEDVEKSGRQDLKEEMDKTGKVDAVHKKLRAALPLDDRIRAIDKTAKHLLAELQGIAKALRAGGKATPAVLQGLKSQLVQIGSFATALHDGNGAAKVTPRLGTHLPLVVRDTFKGPVVKRTLEGPVVRDSMNGPVVRRKLFAP